MNTSAYMIGTNKSMHNDYRKNPEKIRVDNQGYKFRESQLC